MNIIAVDLAAKYSAAVEMDDSGRIYSQCDSWGRTEDEWVAAVTHPWGFADPPDLLVVEDLPHGVPFMINTKAVCRLQGRIADRMHSRRALDAVRFITPIAWRTHFELKSGSGPDAVVETAKANGYTPPDMTGRTDGRGATKATAAKITTDYCAAFLIASWFHDAIYLNGGSTDFPGTSRYGEPPPPRRARLAAVKEKTRVRKA